MNDLTLVQALKPFYLFLFMVIERYAIIRTSVEKSSNIEVLLISSYSFEPNQYKKIY